MAKVEDNDKNRAACHCPKCPTMNQCGIGKGENLFCGRGKGSCDYKSNGCICGSCPVHRDNHLQEYYYCKKGSAEIIG